MKTNESKLIGYSSRYLNDSQLNVWHLMIILAILYLAYRQRKWKSIKVSRKKLMAISHIKTLPTYHKYFKELQNLGYLTYAPSFHPASKSVVELNLKRLSRLR